MYWLNGTFFETDQITLPIHDPGLLYGATIFTTLRVWQNSLDHPLSFWQEHCDRLRHSIQSFSWPEPNWLQLRHGAETIAQQYPVLRITLFPDGREWITGRSLPANLEQWQQEGISAWVAPKEWRRSLPGHKTGDYLACWLAGQQALAQGYQEAILTDDQGNWLETSTGNLWGWADDCWWTPPLDTVDQVRGKCREILPGVGRSHLIRVLKWHNIKVKESIWDADQVSHFNAVIYTNSVRHVVPIHHVHHQMGVDAKTGNNERVDNAKDDGKYEKGHPLTYHPHHPQIHRLSGLFNTLV